MYTICGWRMTYSVVAFMVTVRLVEKMLNRNVGVVMVASLMTKYSTLEMRCKSRRMRVNHDIEVCSGTTSLALTTASLARATTDERASVGSARIAVAVVDVVSESTELMALLRLLRDSIFRSLKHQASQELPGRSCRLCLERRKCVFCYEFVCVVFVARSVVSIAVLSRRRRGNSGGWCRRSR